VLKEFFTAALGMQNQNTRLEVIANNLANANTNGYKSANVFERNLIDASENFNNVSGNVEQMIHQLVHIMIYQRETIQKQIIHLI